MEKEPAKITSGQSKRGRPRKTKEVAQMIVVDKHNNVSRDGTIIGRIELDGVVFVGINLITRRQVKSFDYDAVVGWFKG